ncbi:MAG: ribose ABC transporter permease [Candidatus Atribacteria bacterium]|jgi:ribose transport system permease protein|nr:MAG: ribose ABC transporter permease [Candidatus Atribacteria bacterium]
MKNLQFKDIIRRYGILIGLIGLITAFSILSERFFTISNMLIVMRQTSIVAFLAVGMSFVIIGAGIDLSVGSVLAFSGAVGAGVMQNGGIFFGILAGLALGTALGAFNGIVITKLKIPAFIATLAMMAIARGGTLVYTDGRPITGLPSSFAFLGRGYIGNVPFPIILMLIIFILAYIILKLTRFGRYVYATGGNINAARASGIKVDNVIISTFAISGFLSGLTGMVLASRLNSAQPTAGVGYELDAIAAVVLGGTNLFGGEGELWGTLVGAFIMGILNNGLNMLNVSSFYQQVVKGIVILIAVTVAQSGKK